MEDVTRSCASAGCGMRFEVGNQKKKRFCSERCRKREEALRNAENSRRRSREYYAKNREDQLRKAAVKYRANPQPAKEKATRWYQENKDLVSARQKARRALDPAWRAADLAASRAWYLAHKDIPEFQERQKWLRAENSLAAIERVRKWREANPVRYSEWSSTYTRSLKVRERRKALRLANPGQFRLYDQNKRVVRAAAVRVPFTASNLTAKMAFWGEKCWMCGGPFEHVDHVKPLSRGGWHALANLRPACGDCNMTKHAKWFGPKELGRFLKT